MFDKLKLFWIEIEFEKIVPGAEGDAHNLPNYYGELNYEIKKNGIEAIIFIYGDVNIPEGDIRFVVPKRFRKERIELDDIQIEPNAHVEVIIRALPAKVELIYWK